eukprot:TCONS_00033050-protein
MELQQKIFRKFLPLILLFYGGYSSVSARINYCKGKKPLNMHGMEPNIDIKEINTNSSGEIGFLPVQSMEWELKLTIKFHSFVDSPDSIRIIQVGASNCWSYYGCRSPMLKIKNNVVKFWYDVNYQTNQFTTKEVSLGMEYQINFSQLYIGNGKYRFTCMVDGHEFISLINNGATQFYNQNIVCGGRDEEIQPNWTITYLTFTNFM